MIKYIFIRCVRYTVIFLSVAAISLGIPFSAGAYSARSMILMEESTETILVDINCNKVLPMASTTKIMTALVVLENADLNANVVIPAQACGVEGSSMYLIAGETLSVRDLLYGLMLTSGNDAAVALAIHVGGSEQRFVEMMNEKARDIGMKQTHFSNPSGLDEEDEGNLSTVKEMAMLYRYCCQNPLFNQIVKTKEYKRLDGKGYWHNKNRLLKEYPYCVGGKTGYTKKAKRTLITRAIKKQVDLIIVTFNCGNDFEFHQKKYEECFKNYEKLVLFDKGVRNIKGNWYLFENDLLMSKEKDESVSYLIHNEEMFIYRNQTYIKKIKLKKYRFRNFYLMILKDLVYE